MRRILLLIIILFLISCKSDSDNQPPSISIGNQVFQFKKTDSINSLAIIRSKNQNYESALSLFNQALKLEPNHPTVLNNIALTYECQEQFDKAEEYYKKALTESDSTYYEAGSNLGLLYYRIGEYQNSIEILTLVIEGNAYGAISTIAYINRAYTFMAMGNCEMAEKDIKVIHDFNSLNQNIIDQVEKLDAKLLNCVQQRLYRSRQFR